MTTAQMPRHGRKSAGRRDSVERQPREEILEHAPAVREAALGQLPGELGRRGEHVEAAGWAHGAGEGIALGLEALPRGGVLDRLGRRALLRSLPSSPPLPGSSLLPEPASWLSPSSALPASAFLADRAWSWPSPPPAPPPLSASRGGRSRGARWSAGGGCGAGWRERPRRTQARPRAERSFWGSAPRLPGACRWMYRSCRVSIGVQKDELEL